MTLREPSVTSLHTPRPSQATAADLSSPVSPAVRRAVAEILKPAVRQSKVDFTQDTSSDSATVMMESPSKQQQEAGAGISSGATAYAFSQATIFRKTAIKEAKSLARRSHEALSLAHNDATTITTPSGKATPTKPGGATTTTTPSGKATPKKTDDTTARRRLVFGK